MSTSIAAPTPPAGHFFRVSTPNRDGDIQVKLMRAGKKRFFLPVPDVQVAYNFVFRRDLSPGYGPTAIHEAMLKLKRTHELFLSRKAYAGDYPPKTTIG